jgi:chorismate mutase
LGLSEHRRDIERIDEEMIRLVHRRIDLAKKIFEDKRAEGLSINDPEQEELVLRRAMDLATELNLDSGAVKEIFEILIQMSLQKQHELLGKEQG